MMRTVFNPSGDRNTGAGYGTTKAKFSGKDYPAPSTYPYDEPVEELFDFTDEDAQAKLTLSSISASLSVNLEDPTSVVFPYADYADQYNTQRTLFIDKQYTNNTVYITA